MRISLLIALLVFWVHSSAQLNDSLPYDSSIHVFIEGYKDSGTIDIGMIRKGFRLGLSDSSYRIKSFYMSWFSNNGIFTIFPFNGDSVDPRSLPYPYKLEYAYTNSKFFFDNIVVTKQGNDYRARLFLIKADDYFKKFISLKNPLICFDQNRQLKCYNDGNYKLYFTNNLLTGFSTTDSLVRYYENEKLFEIINSKPNQHWR